MHMAHCRFRGLVRAAVVCLLVWGAANDRLSAAPPLDVLEEQAFKEAAALVSPSVVRIQTVGGLDRVGDVLTATGPTTGVVVSADGYIISSAFNFISKPASILVQLADGRRFPAVLVATDRSKMLALLKTEASGLTPAPAAPREKARVGHWAIALGRTYDTPDVSMSVGIVSALNRVWGKALQTDAKVSPVNYGGPLVNIEGEVLGVLVPLSPQENEETAGVEWYDSGIGFAIPMEDAYAAAERLKAGEDLKPGLMGITFKPGGLGAKPIIDRVRVESPAEKAGLKPGDVIVEVEGRPVRRPDEAKFVLGGKYAGDALTVVVQRDGQKVDARLTLVGELIPYESGFLGILPAREGKSEPRAPGVGVRFVYENSPAARAGLAARDRILRVNDTEVTSAAVLTDVISRLRPESKISLVFRRQDAEQTAETTLASIPNDVLGELRTAPVPLSAKPAADGGAAQEQKEELKRGRFTVDLPNRDQGYWSYVPDDYNADAAYGLMIWLHPEGDTMEAAVLQAWRPICDARGLIIAAPKPANASGWSPADAGFIKEVIDHVASRYSIDPARIFVHGYAGSGPMATLAAFKHRELIRGVCLASSPLAAAPPENHPDYRLQWHFACGESEGAYKAIQASAALLRKMKYPASLSAASNRGQKYPSDEQVEEMGRWADALDRI